MSVNTGIVLGSLASFAASRPVRRRSRSLGFAAALALASIVWASAASAADSPDIWITTKVKMALLMAEDVPATAVRVDTTDGKVTLYGTVSSTGQKARAAAAASDVEGVREVRDLLQIVKKSRQESAAVADGALSSQVRSRLAADPALSDSKIEVKSVNQGVVLLDGEAKTLSAHLRALEVTRAVPGVQRVASGIKSPETLADDEIWRDETKASKSSAAGSAMTDTWITTASKVRLMANSSTPAQDINVDTRAGVVTLFGSVPTESVKRSAEEEVRKVDAVKSVKNDLQVVPHVSAAAVEHRDEALTSAIEKRLEARGDLSDSNIDVEVANGVARLTGSVASQSDRLTALTLARTTDGVRSVIGDLTLKAK